MARAFLHSEGKHAPQKRYPKNQKKMLAPYWASSLLWVCFTEPIEDCRFVSDGPAVMSWWNVSYISRAELHFLTIVRSHTQST